MKSRMDNRTDSHQKTHRVISFKKSQPHFFLRVKLSIEGEDVNGLTDVQYKFLVLQAVQENLGHVGSSQPIDVLKLMKDGEALLRVPSKNAQKLWAALTLYGATPSGKRCAFTVLQASPFLMGLACDSSTL